MKKILIFTIIFCMIFIPACGQNQELQQASSQESPQASTADSFEENPFSQAELEENENIDYNFSFGVENYDNDKMQINYRQGKLKINFQVDVEGKGFSCGPLIFIDGICQKYSVSKNEEEAYVNSVEVEKGKNIIETFLQPQLDLSRKKHSIYFLLMFKPDFKYEEGKNLEHAFKISQLPAWDFVIDNKKAKDFAFTGNISNIEPTKIDEKKYLVDGETELNTNNLSLRFSENEKKFLVFGGQRATYRTCLFLDGKLLKMNDNNDYLESSISGEKGCEISYNLDGIDKNNHILYSITIPVSNFDIAMAAISEARVVKGE